MIETTVKGKVVPEIVTENKDVFTQVYNPDVLLCLANLSSDEVFTPPEVANQMLDMLPQELFQSPDIKFLDPACKSGVFLREIAKRLIVGLEDKIPDLQDRINHICKDQLYGIAITELTSLLSRRSLYCSKYPNGPFSIAHFDNVEGNIRYKICQHEWEGPVKWVYDEKGNRKRDWRKCKWCGASEEELGSNHRDGMESHAYEFIHTITPEEIFDMKFDVIISNPPYQLNDAGNGKSAKPIYQLFVNAAKRLNPRFLTMVIPSRWFAGGKGLDDFRSSMLKDRHIRKLVDYENFKDIFPGVDLAGGACYFLWDRDNEGICSVTNFNKDELSVVDRYMDEFDVFIRSNKALSIVHKVQNEHKGKYLDTVVSSRKPFGLPTNYEPQESGIPCQFIQRIGLKYAKKADVTDPFKLLDKWKFIAPKAPIAGQTDFTKPVNIYYDSNTKIIPPGTCCTESFIVLYAAKTKEEVESFKSYMFTKTARFLLLLSVVSQDITKDRFRFVPDLGRYTGEYTDKMLCELWGITDEEWAYIDSRIVGKDGEE